MPTITISKKALENLAGKKLPLEKLKERISYLGTDLEGISEKDAWDTLEKLRHFKNKIFFESITEKTKEIFL